MDFLSNAFSSFTSGLFNNAISSAVGGLANTFTSGLGSLFSSATSTLGGLFSSSGDSAPSAGLPSVFKDGFDAGSSSPSASIGASAPSADVSVRSSDLSAVSRFSSSFDFSSDDAPMALPKTDEGAYSLSEEFSSASTVQLRHPVADSAQFDRLFPSFYDDIKPKQAELELKQDPGFMSSEALSRALQADSYNTHRADGARPMGSDNFLTDADRFGSIRNPGPNDGWRDRPVYSVNGEAVVGSSNSEKAFNLATFAVPFGTAAKGGVALEAAAARVATAAEFPTGSIFARAGVEIPAVIGRETPIYRAMNLTEMNGAEWLAGSGAKAERYAGWNMGASEGYDYVSMYSAGGGFKQTTVGQVLEAGGRIEVIDGKMIAIKFPESGALPGSIWKRLALK